MMENEELISVLENENSLAHYGAKGQEWGKRRWQYDDGSLTPAGRVHYGVGERRTFKDLSRKEKKLLKKELKEKEKKQKEKAAKEAEEAKRKEEIEKAIAEGDNEWAMDHFDQMTDDEFNRLMNRYKAKNQMINETRKQLGITKVDTGSLMDKLVKGMDNVARIATSAETIVSKTDRIKKTLNPEEKKDDYSSDKDIDEMLEKQTKKSAKKWKKDYQEDLKKLYNDAKKSGDWSDYNYFRATEATSYKKYLESLKPSKENKKKTEREQFTETAKRLGLKTHKYNYDSNDYSDDDEKKQNDDGASKKDKKNKKNKNNNQSSNNGQNANNSQKSDSLYDKYMKEKESESKIKQDKFWDKFYEEQDDYADEYKKLKSKYDNKISNADSAAKKELFEASYKKDLSDLYDSYKYLKYDDYYDFSKDNKDDELSSYYKKNKK